MERLDDPGYIAKLDKSKMRMLIGNLPDQFSMASKSFQEAKLNLKARFSSVVVAGMGGSAIGGDLVSAYFSSTFPAPVWVVRDYEVPSFVTRNTLLIAVSYSGNTEETLSAFEDGKGKRARIVCIASGGSLMEMAKSESIPFLTVPGGMPPRCAIGFLSTSILLSIGLAFDVSGLTTELEEVGDVLKKMKNVLEPDNPVKKNPAKKIAGKLAHKLPFVYSSSRMTDPVARRWSTQINENAKSLCHYSSLPELDHNEIVGWGIPREVSYASHILFLDPGNLSEKLRRRLAVTKEIISQMAEVESLTASGTGNLARLFSLVFLGDYVSFYLAMLNGVDPTPIERIDLLKKKLKEGH